MKKSLVALAALAATGAFAQSSVTLSGTFDLSVQNAKNDVASVATMAKNGVASSRIQFAGTEDLGGGMKANFICDTTLTPNAGVAYASAGGTAATATTSLCDRIGLVGVSGNFGRVDLGGDYTPMFRITGIADPFGTNGVASWYNLGGVIARGVDLASASIGTQTSTIGATNVSYANPWYSGALSTSSGARATESVASVNATRSNNTVTYSTPVVNGFQAVYMHILDGVASATNTTGKLGAGSSLRIRYDAGPLTVAVGTQSVKHGLTSTTTADLGTNIVAASYNAGVATVTFGYQTQKLDSLKGTDTIIGLIVPMGTGTIKASYANKSVDTADNSGSFGGKQVGLGYIYSLSKRTDAYVQYARVTNDANAQYGVLTPTAGQSSTAYQMGVRHAF